MKYIIFAAFFISLAFGRIRVHPPNVKIDTENRPNFTVAKNLNLDSLVGDKTYYNILSKPDFIDRICHCTEASYKWNADKSHLIVSESCKILASTGPTISQESELIPKGQNENGKMTRSDFGGFLHTPYDILDVADDYSWIAIGEPDLNHFWLLSTKPTLDQRTIKKVLDKQRDVNGFDFSDIIYTDQSCHQNPDIYE